MSGRLQIFVRTKDKMLIKISPKLRLPRNIKCFNALMAQLLQKQYIKSKSSPEILLKTIKNPVTDHLPFNTRIISTNEKAQLVDLETFLKKQKEDDVFAFVIGAISKGDLDVDYNNEVISISEFPLSAGVVCGKICGAFEKHWGIL